jgi:hypothetical protein
LQGCFAGKSFLPCRPLQPAFAAGGSRTAADQTGLPIPTSSFEALPARLADLLLVYNG